MTIPKELTLRDRMEAFADNRAIVEAITSVVMDRNVGYLSDTTAELVSQAYAVIKRGEA